MSCTENLGRNLEDVAEMTAMKNKRVPRRSGYVAAQSVQPFNSSQRQKPHNNGKLTSILSIGVLLGVVALVVAWSVKNNMSSRDDIAYRPPVEQHQDFGNYPPRNPYPQYPTDPRPSEEYRQTQQMVQKVWERTKWTTDRLTLMAMLTNHNTAVAQYNYPKTDYVYLNPDWTIDKMPKHLNLDTEDRAFLQRFMRAGEGEKKD